MKSLYTILADDSAIVKPLLDDRNYRFIKLNSNDLHVLAIHDPTTDRSAASLDVNVGSFADKKYGIPGLAHFCEHLLFMGTSKYPEENEYSSYLSKHSGHSNAYTAAEHTNYYFEVGADYLEGALDRFAQFFISPLFSKSCKQREIKAVDSENKKNLQNDLWRVYQLDKLTSNPDHPYNGFSTGNLSTLNDIPESQGINVRDVLLDFYKEQYSSNIMSLVVLGKEPLDDLTDWAITKFSDVPNTSLARPSYNGKHIFTPAEMGKLTKIKSIMDSNKLELSFLIPDDMERLWESKPALYFSHLLGHEGKGSLLHFLKNKNWVNELSAGNMKVCEASSLFMMELDLTPKGLANWEKIVVHAFEYLKMVTESEPEQWLWKEISDMSKIDFRFRQKVGASNTVSKLSNTLYKFTDDYFIPPENLLNEKIIIDFNPNEIKKYGSFLNWENVRISLSSQLFENLPSTEKWYGTEYLFEDIPSSILQTIRNVSKNELLHLPHPNNFIPENFVVNGEKTDTPLQHPHLISDSAKFETWFKQDDTFRVPRGYINLTIHAPLLAESVRTAVLGTLFCELLDDELVDLKYYASIVGLSSSIFQYRDAFSIKLGGYNDKLPELLRQILEKLNNFKLNPDRFESIKYKIMKDLKNAGYEIPYSQIGTHFLQLINEKTYSDLSKIEALQAISFEDINDFANNQLWSKGVFVQTLIQGNFEYTAAEKVDNLVKELFKEKKKISENKDEVEEITKFQSFALETGEISRYELPLQDANNVNSCLEYFIQVGKLGAENSRLRVLTDLLSTTIHEPCFNQLRTKEQLGYVVFSGLRVNRTFFGLRVLVQSERPCDFLEARIDNFLEMFETKNLGRDLTDESFEKFKNALKIKKLAKLKNLHEECNRFWNSINDGYYDFTQKVDDVEILSTITKEEFLKFFRDYISVRTRTKSAVVSVYLNSQKVPEFDRKKNFSTAVHNYVFEHGLALKSDLVDEIVESNDYDLDKVVKEIYSRIGQELNEQDFTKSFTSQVLERTENPVPVGYPKGKLFTSDESFKRAHSVGGRPNAVKPLSIYYYPKEGAHL